MVVDNISVGVQKGECFGLLGQNGAGKTTTFKMLTGYERVSGGNAYVAGYDVLHNIKKVQANLGYCPQQSNHIEWLTVRQTLKMYARLRGVPKRDMPEVVTTLIDVLMLGPDANTKVRKCSDVSKRKLSIAIALVGMPEVILLDEPSTGSDPHARRHLWNILTHVRALGHTVVFTTHNMEEIEALCSRLVFMMSGQFVCLGTPDYLDDKYGQGHALEILIGLTDMGTRQPTRPIIEYISQHIPEMEVFDESQYYLLVLVPSTTVKVAAMFQVMEIIKQYYYIRDYSIRKNTLENLFIAYTGSGP